MIGAFHEWTAAVDPCGVDVSACIMRGPRAYQEDRIATYAVDRMLFLLLVDGHGGAGMAHFVQEQLCPAVASLLRAGRDVASAMRDAVVETDERARACVHVGASGACVALVCMQEDGAVTVCSLGDVQVFAATHGRLCAPHTVEHDRARLAALGASFTSTQLVIGRVRYRFARSMGDFAGKTGPDRRSYIISNEPQLCRVQRPDWILMCTDGLTDGIAHDNVPGHVCKWLSALREPLQRRSVPFALCHDAIVRGGSRDNTSCIWIGRHTDERQDDEPRDMEECARICEARLQSEALRSSSMKGHSVHTVVRTIPKEDHNTIFPHHRDE